MKDKDSLELLLEKLRWLRLPGMARIVAELLEVLQRLCDEERTSRINSAIARRIKGARFPELNTIDQGGERRAGPGAAPARALEHRSRGGERRTTRKGDRHTHRRARDPGDRRSLEWSWPCALDALSAEAENRIELTGRVPVIPVDMGPARPLATAQP